MAPIRIKILSAGAPKIGVSRCVDAFVEKISADISITFATAPVIEEKVNTDQADVDIVIAPAVMISTFMAQNKLEKDVGSGIGSVKTAVVIRNGAKIPDISNANALKQEMLAADSLVYNKASSGQYVEEMIERLGIADNVLAITARTDTGAGVMEYLDQSSVEKEIGFAQQTEIQVQIDKGLNVKLVGPLPKELEKATSFASGLLRNAANPEGARNLLEFMASDEGKAIFISTGVE
jgi:molybdate transport system substrate-binding protein